MNPKIHIYLSLCETEQVGNMCQCSDAIKNNMNASRSSVATA